MNKISKNKISQWLPDKNKLKNFLILSLLIWGLILGVYWFIMYQKTLSAGSNQGLSILKNKYGGGKGSEKIDENMLNEFDAKTHLKQGRRFLRDGDAKKALRHFFRAEISLNNKVDLYEMIGDAFLMLLDFESAESEYKKALEKDKNNPVLLSKLGLSIFYQNDVNDGIKIIRSAIKKDSSCGECYSALGRALSDVEPPREKEASEAFFHSMYLTPKNPDIYYQYSKFLMKHRRYKESESVLRHITEKFPLYVRAHARLGIVYYYLKKYKLCEREYNIALTMSESDYNTWYNLGEYYYLIQNNSAKAMKCFNRAVKLNPGHSKAHFRMGLIYFRNQQYKESINHYFDALKKRPRDIKILVQLAISYEKLKRYGDAIGIYDKILFIDPANKIAKYKKELIVGG